MASSNLNNSVSDGQLTFGLANVHSMVKKKDQVHDVIKKYRLDAFAITETWIYEHTSDAVKNANAPKDYSIVHVHRPPKPGASKARGGGIAIIHRDGIQVTVLSNSDMQAKYKTFELLLVKLKYGTNCLNIAVIYKPPKAADRTNTPPKAFINELEVLVKSKVLGSRYIFCGDFNCPGPAKTYGEVNKNLTEFFKVYKMTQHVQKATCTTKNLLDHIITSNEAEGAIKDLAVREDVIFTDHYLITCSVDMEINRLDDGLDAITEGVRSGLHVSDDVRSDAAENECDDLKELATILLLLSQPDFSGSSKVSSDVMTTPLRGSAGDGAARTLLKPSSGSGTASGSERPKSGRGDQGAEVKPEQASKRQKNAKDKTNE